MTAIKHRFPSGKAAAADPTLVDGPNWDDTHVLEGGLDGQVVTRDSAFDPPAGDGWKWAFAAMPVRFVVQGVAAVGQKLVQVLLDRPNTIARVRVWSDDAPAGADLIIDLKVNGTSIWSVTPANRARVLAGQQSGVQTTFDTASVAEGDRLSLDIVQVGSTTPGGNDLLVTVELR